MNRLNPLINERNDGNNDDLNRIEVMNRGQGGIDEDRADFDQDPIMNIEDGDQNIPPASPPRNDIHDNMDAAAHSLDDIYAMLLQNNHGEDHVLVADEINPDNFRAEFGDVRDMADGMNEDNLFEVPLVEDDLSDEDEIPNNNIGNNAIGDDDENAPLYFEAEITVRESNLAILSLYLKHNLSSACLADIIKLVMMHCPQRNLKKNSLFKFQKYFNLGEGNGKKHYYCPSCVQKLNNENDVCRVCPNVKSNYFVELPVIQHLTEMYRRENFYNSLQKRFERPIEQNVISDVYDGQLYKDWNVNFLSHPHNISLSWYTDGISVFKSSKVGTYVIYLTVNELPFEMRKKLHNTLLLGIWFGDKKPHFNTFMYAFRPVFEKLYRGIRVALPDWNIINVRAVLLMGVCDLPAKCDSLNFVQFNGYHGCPVCFIRGETTEIAPNSGRRILIYPFTENFVLRTAERCEELALQATTDNPQLGVKGPTALSKIMPDFLKGMCSDRMHLMEGGVAKKMFTLQFHSSYHNSPFSLHRHIDEINRRLQMIKPPKFIHRMPRKTNDLIHWKASELKSFLYYYSLPVFEGLMTREYFDHYLLLIFAMNLLSADRIDTNMIDIAEDFIFRFVREFDVLYGLRYSSINVHLLLHLPNNVREQGPLWAHTCYEYEDMNGRMLNLVHGTRYIGSQVANGHQYLLRMVKDVEQIENQVVKDFCMDSKKQSNITDRICDDGYSVGKLKVIEENPEVIVNALNNSEIIVDGARLWHFSRVLKNNKLYVSETYTRIMKTSTSVVKYHENGLIKIGSIWGFVKYFNCRCMQAVCDCEFKYFAIIREFINDGVYVAEGNNFRYDSSSFFHKCRETNNVKAVTTVNLITPCIYMSINEQSYVAFPINTKELE